MHSHEFIFSPSKMRGGGNGMRRMRWGEEDVPHSLLPVVGKTFWVTNSTRWSYAAWVRHDVLLLFVPRCFQFLHLIHPWDLMVLLSLLFASDKWDAFNGKMDVKSSLQIFSCFSSSDGERRTRGEERREGSQEVSGNHHWIITFGTEQVVSCSIWSSPAV